MYKGGNGGGVYCVDMGGVLGDWSESQVLLIGALISQSLAMKEFLLCALWGIRERKGTQI